MDTFSSSGCEKGSQWDSFFSDASLTGEELRSELRPANDTSHFDQLLDDQTDMAIYGHVHKQVLRYGSKGQQILNPGTIGMPYFDWSPLQNHRLSMP